MTTMPPAATPVLPVAYPPGDYRLTPQPLSGTGLQDMLQDSVSEIAAHPSTPTYLFRGQTRRHTDSWPPEPREVQGHSIAVDSYELDLLLPTFARQLWALAAEGRRQEPGVHLAYDTPTYWLRARLVMYATFQRAMSQGIPASEFDDWLFDNQGHPWDKMISVGQHTGVLPTHVLDATSHLAVALWFALGAWGGLPGAVPNEAVIYKIDRAALAALEPIVTAATGYGPAGAFRHVYCYDTDDAITRRPSLQHGWSLAGWDDPWLYFALVATGGIKAFSLPTQLPTDVTTAVSDLGNILPEPDPIALLIDSVLSCDDRIQQFLIYLQNLPDPQQSSLPSLLDPNVRIAVRHGWVS